MTTTLAMPHLPASPSAPQRVAAATPGDGTAGTVSAAQLRELHLLWSRVHAGSWRTLALVPADAQGSGFEVGTGLVQASQLFGSAAALQLVDARGVRLEDAAALASRIAAQVAAGTRVLLVTDSPLESAVPLALLQSADAALLCAQRGMALDSARRTLELCGRERFVGSVLLPAGR